MTYYVMAVMVCNTDCNYGCGATATMAVLQPQLWPRPQFKTDVSFVSTRKIDMNLLELAVETNETQKCLF